MSSIRFSPPVHRFAVQGVRRLLLVLCCSTQLPLLSLTAGENRPDTPARSAPSAVVSFNRDIRPILSDKCFFCHGPDAQKRKADLRLDTESGMFGTREGGPAVVPGKIDQSLLYARLIEEDPTLRMPPQKSGHHLTPSQIEMFRRWIEQGAKWEKHWSFLPVVRPVVPAVRGAGWVRNPIDAFVLAKLEAAGLQPSPEGDRITLLRRVSFDLTGLPPTPEEVDRFLADASPRAYETAVDRLLASPRYGERMAMRWLDGARYADTSGYQTDGPRDMWRWRDWVIDAFNRNLPFDQFTLEQLAGDLLPQRTLEQLIATGFNRNHRGNAEGGIIPEEYATEYVADRVETTCTVWLGLTMMCGRCHNHKYDPLTQNDFYQLFAYFNSIPEKGRALKFGNSPPYIPAPTAAQQDQLLRLTSRIETADHELDLHRSEIAAAQRAWEQASRGQSAAADWYPSAGLVAYYPLEDLPANLAFGTAGQLLRTGTVTPSPLEFVPGRVGKAAHFNGRQAVDCRNIADFGFADEFSWSVWIHPDTPTAGGTIFSKMVDELQGTGVSLVLQDRKLLAHFGVRWLDDAIRVQTAAPVATDQWLHVAVTYDGSRKASGVRMFVNGEPVRLKVDLDEMNQTFQTKEPFRLGAGHGPQGRFRGTLDELRIFDRVLPEDELRALSVTEPLPALAALPPARRARREADKLRLAFLQEFGPFALRALYKPTRELRKERDKLIDSWPTVMVMEELPQPRPAHVLLRGEYNKPGAAVHRGVPAALGPLPAGAPQNRLGFAQWLVSPRNPLTARVTANRLWQMYFGTGLVKTVEDFGSQGEWPSHPELLDWLAAEFMQGEANGRRWDLKQLHRRIVTSATYRQSSASSAAAIARDPDNRLLARGPRVRLPAEMVRDQALLAAGLLVEKIGGPSVKPYQPAGLWKDLSGTDYVQDHGEKLYRRGLYTFWKRTAAPPTMILFDSAGRETCIVRENRTNTPLQALTLMNETSFIEAARQLAERALEAGLEPEARLIRAFRLVLSRPPRAAELRILRENLETQRQRFHAAPEQARALLTVGESAVNPRHPVPELAAYAVVSSLILNLDEAITKE